MVIFGCWNLGSWCTLGIVLLNILVGKVGDSLWMNEE